MNKGTTGKARPYSARLFVLTTIVYALGVVVFSFWPFFSESSSPEHRIHMVALIKSGEILFLFLMTISLIVLYHRSQAHSSHQVEELNIRLQRDNETLKQHEKELQNAIHDLERFNTVATGRELRIIELKSEVNEVLEELNRAKRYTTAPSRGTNE